MNVLTPSRRALAMGAVMLAVGGLAGAFTSLAQAQASAGDHAAHHPPAAASAAAPAASASAASLADGEVRRIDRAQKKLTLRHGPIASLDMPGMTMVFVVADERLLNDLAVGDKVRFAAEKADGAFVVTTLEKAAP